MSALEIVLSLLLGFVLYWLIRLYLEAGEV